jgi:hypothetical protein
MIDPIRSIVRLPPDGASQRSQAGSQGEEDMFRNASLLIGFLLVFDFSQAGAQPRRARAPGVPGQDHKAEISFFGGYSWTFSRNVCGIQCGELDVKSSGFWGISGDINVMPGTQLSILYNRQDSDVTFRSDFTRVRETITDVAVEYYHVGVLQGVPMGMVVPFGGATLGATRYAYGTVTPPAGTPFSPDDDWKFSIILQGGAKVYLSDRLGLRAQARLPFVFWSGGLGIGCGTGGCGTSLVGYGMAQIDVSAGLMLLL